MKKAISYVKRAGSRTLLGLLLLLAVGVTMVVLAAPTPLVTVTINNATNTVTGILAWAYNQPLQNATITHGPLTNLTSCGVNIYVNAPNSTATNGRVFIGTWYPSTTNSATETITGANFQVTNYLSFDLWTTNPVSLSGGYGN